MAVRSDETEGRTLIRSLRTSGFTALLGSRISSWEPSNLPAAMDVTRSLARLLSRPLVYYPSTIETLIERTAFEHVMQACPESAENALADNLVRLYGTTAPNPVHHAIAALIEAGVIRHVVTTNYDDGIERACRALSGPRTSAVQVIIEPTAVDLTRPVIFKIHGCAVADTTRPPGAPRSVVFRLAQEGLLEQWKRDVLSSIVAGQLLVVCGYSGLDFEICPEIEALAPCLKGVAWNSWKDPRVVGAALSPNAVAVLKSTRGTALVGDMVEIFAQLAGPVATKGSAARDVTSALVRGLSAWDLDAWRLSLFSSIGCATEGVRLAQAKAVDAGNDPQRRWTALHGMGQSLFHQGSYYRSRDWYLRASAVAATSGLVEEEFRSELDAAEAERAAGRWIKAWRRRERANAKRTGPTHFGVFLRRALLAKRPYLLGRRIGLCPRAFRSWLETTLRSAAERALRDGSRLDYQQCALIAEEVGLDVARVFAGLPVPLSSLAGYRHLGYFVAECQSIRQAIDSVDEVPDLSELLWRLDRLWELGAGPEMSKLASAVRRRHGAGALSRVQRGRAAEMLRRSEYAWWVGLIIRLGWYD